MKNLYDCIAYSLLTVTAVGMFSIGYSINRMQKKVTKLGYVSTELKGINRIMKNVKTRVGKVNQNTQNLLIEIQKFNEELRLRQIIREELKLNGLRKKLE